MKLLLGSFKAAIIKSVYIKNFTAALTQALIIVIKFAFQPQFVKTNKSIQYCQRETALIDIGIR